MDRSIPYFISVVTHKKKSQAVSSVTLQIRKQKFRKTKTTESQIIVREKGIQIQNLWFKTYSLSIFVYYIKIKISKNP